MADETRSLVQLPRVSAVSATALTMVEEPNGPTGAIEIRRLLGRLIATDEATATAAQLAGLLDYDANATALVFADPDPAKNGWWRKTGASGAGAWEQFEVLARDGIGLAAANAAAAAASAAAAATSSAGAVKRVGLVERVGPIYPWAAPYVDGGTLRIPRFFHRMDGAYADRAPDGGAMWYEVRDAVDYNAGNSVAYYEAASNSVLLANVYAQPADLGSDARPVIGTFSGGSFTGAVRTAPLLLNDFPGNVTGVGDTLGSVTTPCRVNALELANLRLYYGWTAPAGGVIAVGGLFSQSDLPYCFNRVFVHALDGQSLFNADGTPRAVPTFETYSADHVRDPSIGLESRGAGLFEKRYSDTLASFILVGNRAITPGAVGLRVVLAQPAGRNLLLAGLQFAATCDPSAIIPVIHIDGVCKSAVGHLYVPDEIAFFEDRGFTLYPAQMIDTRPISALMTVSGDGPVSTTPVFTGRDAIAVDPRGIVDGSTLLVSRAFEGRLADVRQTKRVVARKVPAAAVAGKSIRMLFLGDSKVADVLTANQVEAILEGYGANVTRAGTLVQWDGATNQRHEGRSGTRLADWLGKRVDNMQRTTPADYIAAPVYDRDTPGVIDRIRRNPFLFAANGTGSFDGWAFDYVKFLAAYDSILQPHDIVGMDLGTNDKVDFARADDLTDFMDFGYTHMIGSTLAGGKKVLISAIGNGWMRSANEYQRIGGYAIFKGIMRAVRRLNDPRVRLAGAWAQMSPLAFGTVTTSAINQDTATETGPLADPTHPAGSNRYENAACLSAHTAQFFR